MNEIITQIQDLINNDQNFNQEEKKEFIAKLEAIKGDSGFKDSQPIFEALLEKAKNDSNEVKKFFNEMDKSMQTILEKGQKGFDEVADKVNDELDKVED